MTDLGLKILVFLRPKAELSTAWHCLSRRMLLSRRALSLRWNYSYLGIPRSPKEWWILLSNNLFVWGTRELLGKNFSGGGWGGMEGGKGNELSLIRQCWSLPAEIVNMVSMDTQPILWSSPEDVRKTGLKIKTGCVMSPRPPYIIRGKIQLFFGTYLAKYT